MKINYWVSIVLSLNLLESQVIFTQDYNEHQESTLQEAESSLNCYPMMNPEEVTEVQDILRISNSSSFSSRASNPRSGDRILVEGEDSIDFFRNSTSIANCCVAPVLEASSSSCHKLPLAPSTPCTSSAEASLERSLRLQQNPSHITALTENYQKRVLLAESCRKVAEIFQAAAQYAQRVTESLSLGNENEGHEWGNVVKYLELRAKDQIVAIKKIKKVDFSNSDMIQKNNADKIPKTTTVHRMNGTDNTINKMGLSICCEKWLAETNSREGVDKILSDYIVNVLKQGANHQLVQAFEKYWDHVARAHNLGNDPQALAWIQVAEDIQEGIAVSIEQAKAVENAKKAKIIEDENPWDDTYWRRKQLADILKYTCLEMKILAQCREQFIQAEESFQPLEILNYWKAAIEGYQIFTQYYREAAQAHLSGKYEDFEKLLQIAKFGNFHVGRLKHIIERLEKSNSALAREADPELLILRKQVIEYWKQPMEYYHQSLQSIKFCCHQDVINYELFDKIDDNIKLYDLCDLYLVMAFDILEDVTKVRKAHQKESRELVCKAVPSDQGQEEAEQFKGDNVLNASSISEMKPPSDLVDCKDRVSNLLLKASEQFQESVKYYFQTITASLNNNNRLLSKLASADEVQGVDGASGSLWQELLDASGVDISSPSSRDAVETSEARRTKDFDAGLYASSCPSQNSSPTQHSSSLPQVVVDGDETIHSNTGATQQFAAKVEFPKKSNNNCFDKAAQSASTSAYYFQHAASAYKKFLQAQQANQEELVKLHIDKHEHNQETEEYDLITRTEEISQKELAHLWLEIFKQNEETAEYYQKSAKAYAAGNKEEGDCLGGNDDCRQGRGYRAKQAVDRLRSHYRLESDSE